MCIRDSLSTVHYMTSSQIVKTEKHWIEMCIRDRCGGINVASAGNTRRSAVLYNLGRVASYTLVGAIVGALGSAFSLSTAVQAGIQLFAAAFMLAMALNLLGCFRFLPSLRLPGRLSGLFRSRSSFVIGLANGLMPVSYTHLDVYKRQHILPAQQQANAV